MQISIHIQIRSHSPSTTSQVLELSYLGEKKYHYNIVIFAISKPLVFRLYSWPTLHIYSPIFLTKSMIQQASRLSRKRLSSHPILMRLRPMVSSYPINYDTHSACFPLTSQDHNHKSSLAKSLHFWEVKARLTKNTYSNLYRNNSLIMRPWGLTPPCLPC